MEQSNGNAPIFAPQGGALSLVIIMLTDDNVCHAFFIKYMLIFLDRQEFCHNERFTAQCSSDEIIVMTLARYGRMALGRCVKKDYGYIGCGTDVIDIAHAYCSGRRTCEIPVPNAILDSLEQPCPEDFKSYLKAAYVCQRGKLSYCNCI